MKFLRASMMFLICMSGINMVGISHADENIEVMSAEGSVTLGDTQGKTKNSVAAKSIVSSGNVITTGPNARAVVRVGSDGFIVMGKNSQVEIGKSKEQLGFFKQISGVIYYALNSIKSNQRPIEVRTATTTIGIRGTRFIVTDETERNEIGMRKGVINVASLEGDFEIHKKAQQDEFEAYKQQGVAEMAKEKRDFEEYNSKNQKEFIEFKREFSLGASRMASFEGKKVVDLPLSGETQKDMESFENYAEEWLKTVHD